MYQSEEAIETLFSGSYEREGNSIHVRLTADPEIENYLYTAPNSSYTRQDTQPLHVPIIVEIMRDGEVVERYVNRDAELSSDQLTAEVDFSLNALDDEDLNVVMKAAVFDRTMILTGLEVCTQKREQP